MYGATQEELQQIIGQLEQAVHSHDEWFEPELSVEDVIQRADQALYAAKHAGRNQSCEWSHLMQEEGING